MTDYKLKATAGSYGLMEGTAKDTPMRDFLPAVDRCAWEDLPEALGTYPVTLDVTFVVPRDVKASVDVYQGGLDAQLTMEKATLPPQLGSIKFLKALPWVQATVKATGPLTKTVDNEGKQEEVALDDPTGSQLFVSSTAFMQAVWSRYKVNFASLKAYLAATLFEQRGQVTEWDKAREMLVKQAFGHDPAVANGIPARPAYGFIGDTSTPKKAHFYGLLDAYYVTAFLDLVESKEIKLALPSNDCVIQFLPGEDRASVRLLDTWETGHNSPLLPFEAHSSYGKTADQIREMFRLRGEIVGLREERRKILDRAFSLGTYEPTQFPGVRRGGMSKEESQQQHSLISDARKLYAKDAELQERAMALYVDLTHWAAKHKERLLKATREREEVSVRVLESKDAVKDLVALPNNMGRLPAHFAAIPAGLETGLHMEHDQYGRAILRVRRQGLEIQGGVKAPEQIPFSLEIDSTIKEGEMGLLKSQAEMLLGANGPRWLIPQGLVAVSKLYADSGGYGGADSTVRIYLNDWIDTMRPMQVERFRQKGRGEAFGKDHKPMLMFNALLGVLSRLTYDSKTKHPVEGWSELNGFYLITANGNDVRGPWAEVLLNPSLHQFITGDGGLPYMVTNTKAMFTYNSQSLDYAPAAQMGLESFARTNIYNRSTSTLSDPQGGGITRLELASRMGLLRGAGEDNTRVLSRFNRTLDNLGKAGVLAEVKVDGRDKAGGDAFGVKLLVTMHEDYRKAFDLSREKEKLQKLDKQLATPFAEPRKINKPFVAPAAKKRGRPPLKKAGK